MSEHAKLPWGINPAPQRGDEICANGVVICDAYGTDYNEAAANSSFIVRAVNSHAALVEALKNIVDQRVLTPSARSNARAALKLAEGEPK